MLSNHLGLVSSGTEPLSNLEIFKLQHIFHQTILTRLDLSKLYDFIHFIIMKSCVLHSTCVVWVQPTTPITIDITLGVTQLYQEMTVVNIIAIHGSCRRVA